MTLAMRLSCEHCQEGLVLDGEAFIAVANALFVLSALRLWRGVVQTAVVIWSPGHGASPSRSMPEFVRFSPGLRVRRTAP